MKTVHTSIRIPEHLMLKLKDEALIKGIHLTEVINNYLEQGFENNGPNNRDLAKLCHSLSTIADDLDSKDKKASKKIRTEVKELWESL